MNREPRHPARRGRRAPRPARAASRADHHRVGCSLVRLRTATPEELAELERVPLADAVRSEPRVSRPRTDKLGSSKPAPPAAVRGALGPGGRRGLAARVARLPSVVRRAAIQQVRVARRAAHRGVGPRGRVDCPAGPIKWALQSVAMVLNARGGFASYARATLGNAPRQPRPDHAPRETLFPLPSVELMRLGRAGSPRPRHRRRRWAFDHAVSNLTLLMGLALSWEATGRPHAPAQAPSEGATAVQLSVVARLRARAADLLEGCADIPLRELGLGRGTLAAVWDSYDELDATVAGLEREPGYARSAQTCADCATVARAGAEAVDVDRVAWPSVAPALDLAPLLEAGEFRDAFVDPSTLESDPAATPSEAGRSPEPPLRACDRVPRAELHRFLYELDQRGMLHATRSVESDKCGFFGVRKCYDAERGTWVLRLVLDRRPRNARERLVRPPEDTLPHAVCFLDVVLEPDRVLLLSSSDLPAFYYSVLVSEQRAESNRFTDLLDASELQHLQAVRDLHDRERAGGVTSDGARVAFCLATLAMGDLNATAFAQAGHVEMVRQAGAMPPDRTISYRQPWPSGDVAQGIMIDDSLVVAQVPRRAPKTSPAATDARDLYERTLHAYRARGIADVPHKRQVEVHDAVVWGAEVRGRLGQVGVPRQRRAPLAAVTLALGQLGCCPTDLLRRVLGLWTAALLYRRDAFAAIDAIYLHVLKYADDPPTRARALPGPVRSELLLLAALAPLLSTNLRAQVSPHITVTDASLQGAAAVRFTAPAHVARELWRRRLGPGRYGPLDCDIGYRRGDSWVSELCEGAPVREFARFRFRAQPPSINVGEARADRAAIRLLAADPSEHEQRHNFVKDSRVVLAARAKGRARGRLLREFQLSYPHLLAADIYPGQQWGDSERNNADPGTRAGGLPVPAPRRPWASEFWEGDIGALERRLVEEPPLPHVPTPSKLDVWCGLVRQQGWKGSKHHAQRCGRVAHYGGLALYAGDDADPALDDHTPARDRAERETRVLRRGWRPAPRPLADPLRQLRARRHTSTGELFLSGQATPHALRAARDQLRSRLPPMPGPRGGEAWRAEQQLGTEIDAELRLQAHEDRSEPGRPLPTGSRRHAPRAPHVSRGCHDDWTTGWDAWWLSNQQLDARETRLPWLRPHAELPDRGFQQLQDVCASTPAERLIDELVPTTLPDINVWHRDFVEKYHATPSSERGGPLGPMSRRARASAACAAATPWV